MLVPLDTWTRILEQIGNVHEAGQQLAAATERAAKAETEAAFLRERLAELRADDAAALKLTDDGIGHAEELVVRHVAVAMPALARSLPALYAVTQHRRAPRPTRAVLTTNSRCAPSALCTRP